MESKDLAGGSIDVFSLAKYALKRKLIMSLFILLFITTSIGNFSDDTFSGDVVKPIAGHPDNDKIVARFLQDYFFITENIKTEILTLKIIWDSPEEVTRIANELVNDFNQYSRLKDIELFEDQLRLYQEKYSATSVDELRLQLVTSIYGINN
jgi:hypothetical protein